MVNVAAFGELNIGSEKINIHFGYWFLFTQEENGRNKKVLVRMTNKLLSFLLGHIFASKSLMANFIICVCFTDGAMRFFTTIEALAGLGLKSMSTKLCRRSTDLATAPRLDI